MCVGAMGTEFELEHRRRGGSEGELEHSAGVTVVFTQSYVLGGSP